MPAPTRPGTIAIPQDDAPYAAYLSALVKRYGPTGTYWADNPTLPKRPIREWQIWNEPNFTYYWPTRPFAPSYMALVKAAHTAIKQADPGAKVVLAGMPNDAWNYLQKIYNVPHAGRYFDVVAAHPYTVIPSNVILFLQKMRAVMKRNGDAAQADRDHRDGLELLGRPQAVRQLLLPVDRGASGGQGQGGAAAARPEPRRAQAPGVLLLHLGQPGHQRRPLRRLGRHLPDHRLPARCPSRSTRSSRPACSRSSTAGGSAGSPAVRGPGG